MRLGTVRCVVVSYKIVRKLILPIKISNIYIYIIRSLSSISCFQAEDPNHTSQTVMSLV